MHDFWIGFLLWKLMNSRFRCVLQALQPFSKCATQMMVMWLQLLHELNLVKLETPILFAKSSINWLHSFNCFARVIDSFGSSSHYTSKQRQTNIQCILKSVCCTVTTSLWTHIIRVCKTAICKITTSDVLT